MNSFKDMLAKDVADVFNNANEFAEKMLIYYDGQAYENTSLILDKTAKNRPRNKDDYETLTYKYDATAYINEKELGFIPKKNHSLIIDDIDYNIVEVSNEMGEIVIGLEVYDEW